MADQSFTRRVHDLPRELFDIIYHLVFTTPPENRVIIAGKLSMPPPARVSKMTREMFLDSYFRNSTFVCTSKEADYDIVHIAQLHMQKLACIEIRDVSESQPLQSYQRLRNFRRIFASRYVAIRSPTDDTIAMGDREQNEKVCARWMMELKGDSTTFTKIGDAS